MTAAARRSVAAAALILVAGVVAVLAATGSEDRAPAPAPAGPSAPSIVGSAAVDGQPPPRRASPALRRAAAVFAADWLNMLAGQRLASQVRHAAPAVIEQFAGSRPPGGPGARAIVGPPQLRPAAGVGEGWTVRVALRRRAPLQFVIAAGPSGPTVYEVRLD